MTIRKYRGVEEMPLVPRATGAELADRIRSAWARAWRLAGGVFHAPGVQKFTDIESAQEARDTAIRARVQRLRDQRHG